MVFLSPETSKKQWKNLFTYAIILLLGVMIIIMIAAMADSREKELDNQISQTQQTNITIQNELVQLKDENYNLAKENERLTAEVAALNQHSDRTAQLTEVWALYTSGSIDAAEQKLKLVDTTNMVVSQLAYYEALCTVLGVEY